MAAKTKARTVDAVGAAPRKSDARSVVFACHAPGARLVQLVGPFTEWAEHPVAMRPVGEATWETTVELAPGRCQDKFLVDEQWSSGETAYDDRNAACPNCTPNPFGTLNRFIDVV